MVHTLKFKILKSCFNTLPPVDSFFPHLQVLSFPFHNLFVTHFMNKNKFSPWYSLVLCLISGHKRANKHKSLIQNWYENKQAKNIIYVDIWKIIPYLQANQYRLKTNNIDSLIFISTIIKKLLMVFCFLDLVFLRKKRTGLVYIDVLLHRVIGKKETLNKNMILMFLECFYDNTIKSFLCKYCSDLTSWSWIFLCWMCSFFFNIDGKE